LQSLSEFELVVPEGKPVSCLEYPMKVLFVHDKNLGNEELKLLESFVSQHPQTPILFWEGNPMFNEFTVSYQSLKKLRSLEYVYISNGCAGENWPKFNNQFEQLKLVYFASTQQCNEHKEQTWTINTWKTLFMMDFVDIEPLSDNIK
jgi:hypothetical protein